MNQGTTFKIYFPAVKRNATTVAKVAVTERPCGTETVMLIEDEPMVRRLAKKILLMHGYKVIEQKSGGLAIAYFDEHNPAIDLLITDVIMPGMNGRELQEKLQEKLPGLKALFMSGYTENVIAHHGVLDEGTEFIQKPFSIVSLTQKVREVLDG